MALVGLVLFLVVPARRLHVSIDGVERTAIIRGANERHALDAAGFDLHANDRLEFDGDAVTVRRAATVLIQADGRTLTLRTRARTIAGALVEAGIPLDDRDSVLQNGVFVSPAAPLVPEPLSVSARPRGAARGAPPEPVIIEVRRAVTFTVTEDGQQLTFESSRPTVGLALLEMGVRLGPGDDVAPPIDTELTAGMDIIVRHAVPITVALPEGRRVLYTLRQTVGEALDEAGIDLPAGDGEVRVEPPLDTRVRPGLSVHIVLVSDELSLEQEFIESHTVFEPDPGLPPGLTRVVEGRDGVRYRQYRIRYENGVEVGRDLVAEWYDPEPRDTIVYYAPRPAAPALPGGSATGLGGPPPDGARVVRTLRVYATWYNAASAGRAPSDPSYGVTATGVRVTYGVIAVDPNVIPLGTRMYVPGYGYGVAADTGGAVVGHVIDLGYPDGVTPGFTPGWVDIYILAD
jgi:uncharacterized protein YabE (DUF348 family)/3D (Asp-Asp-Asp) domain-containing protein